MTTPQTPGSPSSATFQQRIHPHAVAAYGAAHMADMPTVVGHFVEEAAEAAQATGYSEAEFIRRARYAYSRPVGELPKEIGSVMTTLAYVATAASVDMHAAAEADLQHISQAEVSAGLAARHAAKMAALSGSPSSAVGEREALKPCPFCGSKPYPCSHKTYQHYGVNCVCGAAGPTGWAGPNPTPERIFNAMSEATTAWNRRAAISAPAAEQQAGVPGDYPAITDEDRGLLHYNPNTDDIVEWAHGYADRTVAHRAQQAGAGLGEPPFTLEGVDANAGFWRSCSGCHELDEGCDRGPVNSVFKCTLGNGCSECGGLGAIWDTTDYDAMADYQRRSMGAADALRAHVRGEGYATLMWPKNTTVVELEFIRESVNLQLDGFIKSARRKTERQEAADAEYDSWSPAAAQAPRERS